MDPGGVAEVGGEVMPTEHDEQAVRPTEIETNSTLGRTLGPGHETRMNTEDLTITADFSRGKGPC